LRSFLLLLALPLLTGCIVIPGIPGLGRQDMQEVTVLEPDGWFVSDKYLLVDIDGVISEAKKKELLDEGTSMVEDVREALKRAREDHSIRAVILRINSPGGTVTASDMIHHEIREYSQETGIPVVAVMMDMAASGGYYIACAADRVVASPTTVTGSIGVLMLTVNVQGLEDLAGVEVGAITSGPYKDIMSPFRRMTDEERAIMQGVIDDMYARFVSTVVEGRHLTPERTRELADGRIYTANQALEAGLVDEINYLPQVVDELKEEQGLDDVRVVSYRRQPYGGDYNLYSRSAVPEINVSLIDSSALTQGLEPGFYYMWMPGGMAVNPR
jgi:protease-4